MQSMIRMRKFAVGLNPYPELSERIVMFSVPTHNMDHSDASARLGRNAVAFGAHRRVRGRCSAGVTLERSERVDLDEEELGAP